GAHAAAGPFSVPAVEPVHDVHAFHHLAEWCEAVLVLPRLIAGIDVDLRGARVRPGHGIGERPADIAGAHRVVGKALVLPDLGDGRVACDAKLYEAAFDGAVEARIVEEAGFEEVIETVGS